MIIQAIVNTAEICAQHGMQQAVICPGSRSAPIALAFARHEKIETFVIPDERSAGFFALGLAQSSDRPVAIVCTSGTAVANLYPAIIESFYQQVPLLALTADRPPEWLDQEDGQTIRQQNIFNNHILASYQFPVTTDHPNARWQAEKMISSAILKASDENLSRGPVHINIPIREPFYPLPEEEYQYSKNIKIVRSEKTEASLDQAAQAQLAAGLMKYKRILVLAGQSRISEKLKTSLNRIQQLHNWVVVGDITSNVNSLDHPVTNHDVILSSKSIGKSLRPGLLITFGQGILSKNLKNYLRNEPLTAHWNIGSDPDIDTFKLLTRSINVAPTYFFELATQLLTESKKSQKEFYDQWINISREARSLTGKFFKDELHSEFHAVHKVLERLPEDCNLHLANSMPVRYANLIGVPKHKNVIVWSNRGTSGIDGCISTGVGHAINSKKMNIILSGDMAFFYDRNGLWHNYMPDNLKIIILNNHGGGIFRLINGPKQLHELEEFFETNQKLNAVNTAKDFGMSYFNVANIQLLPDALDQFFDEKTGPSILEIETDPKQNQKVYEDFISAAKKV